MYCKSGKQKAVELFEEKTSKDMTLITKIKYRKLTPSIGGSFYILEFDLLILSDTSCVYMFSLGGKDGIMDPWYYVVDEVNAA